jgi:hypothetical protein
LPQGARLKFVQRHLGPAASGVMKPKVIGRVPLFLEREVLAASIENGAVALTIRGKESGTERLAFDRVIAGTGFRTDIAKLDFLSPSLRKDIGVYGGGRRSSRPGSNRPRRASILSAPPPR